MAIGYSISWLCDSAFDCYLALFQVIPSSIRAALHQNSLPTRPNNQTTAAATTIPQSLKDSAPILTQQLMDYQPPQQQQGQQGHQQQAFNSSQSNQVSKLTSLPTLLPIVYS